MCTAVLIGFQFRFKTFFGAVTTDIAKTYTTCFLEFRFEYSHKRVVVFEAVALFRGRLFK